jgi:hypothetical protein
MTIVFYIQWLISFFGGGYYPSSSLRKTKSLLFSPIQLGPTIEQQSISLQGNIAKVIVHEKERAGCLYRLFSHFWGSHYEDAFLRKRRRSNTNVPACLIVDVTPGFNTMWG